MRSTVTVGPSPSVTLCERCADAVVDAALPLPPDLSDRASPPPEELAGEVLLLRELFTDFVQRSPDLVFQTDEGLRFTYVNDTWTELLGYAPDELIGQPMCAFQPEDSVERDRRVLRALEEGGSIRGHRTVRRHKDGRLFHVLLNARPVRGADGALRGVRGTAVDITEQVNARLEVERARAAAQARTAFLAMMSHELRSPLSNILGFAGVLLREISGPLNDEQRRQVGLIQDSARLLRHLVDDLFDYVRLEGGELRTRIEDVDLSEVARRVVGMKRPAAAEAGLRLTLVTPATAVRARADERRVEQVLLNLVGNAVKFTAEGGIEVVVEQEGDTVGVTVRDTGPGVPGDQLDAIFEPFHRVGGDVEGVGLGLAICRGLARAMGGDVTVVSEPGQGSRFTLRLQAAGPAPGDPW